jgi:DNA-binding NtrC family response regulator
MKTYSWPGNVRQLRNAVMRMAVLTRDEVLGPELLPPEILGAGEGSSSGGRDLTLHDAGRRFEKEYIADVLQRCGGNQTQAAVVLGLQRTHLNRKMKDLGLR